MPIFVDASHDPKHESAVTSTPILYKSTQTKFVSQPQVTNPNSVSTSQEPSFENSVTYSQVDSTRAQVIVVDNIENPKEFGSSSQIPKTLKNIEGFKDIQFAYSLPQGGVALQFKNSTAADKALKTGLMLSSM